MKTVAVCALLLASVSPAAAQSAAPNQMPAALKDVGIDQNLNAQLPLDLAFRDESGQPVTLAKYFTDKPVIVSLVYFSCPMMCPEVLRGMRTSLRQVDFGIGKDYRVLTISFDPKDTPHDAAQQRAENLKPFAMPGTGDDWHFLTGDQGSIQRLTQALGFHYAWDPASQMYAHATAIMILTPQGKVSKYLYGVTYPPRTVRFGLIEASHKRIGSPVDAILLFCCHYNPTSGKYDLAVSHVLAIGGGITIVVLGGFLALMFRSSGKKKHARDRVTV
jgi:protein SCO1/2